YYGDVGQHPEYATPENTSFMGTVVSEFAGEDIVYDSLQNAQQAGVFHDFILTKRVVDDELNTWGYHISLSADIAKVPITEKALAPLGIHLATMNIYTGAGAVIPTKQGAMFTTAQKVLNLNTDFSGSSHNTAQPLLSLRNEALASDDLYSRVHVTSLDANMSPWATWMKLGTTSIVLRMMEHDYLGSGKYFKNDMHKVAVHVAHDTSLNRTVELADGDTILPIDIQSELVLLAEKLAKSDQGLSAEENLVLTEWKRVLTDLRADPDQTGDRVEWVARRTFLRKYMARYALRLPDQQVLKMDRRWSHIGPGSIGRRMRDTAWAAWMPPTERITNAYLHPPTTTRALGRASLIQQYAESLDHNFVATWDTAQHANVGKEWSMLDPYETGYHEYPIAAASNPAFIGPELEGSYNGIEEDMDLVNTQETERFILRN
ncbi:MAG: proteasome accessory factor PafA2 family protein, partial [Candidatus Saccharimonadales bacterium]